MSTRSQLSTIAYMYIRFIKWIIADQAVPWFALKQVVEKICHYPVSFDSPLALPKVKLTFHMVNVWNIGLLFFNIGI